MPEAANLPEIEIFRAGRHTDMHGTIVNVSHADLAAIADAYDPAVGEAPHVVGHPKTEAPAYGWVTKLAARDGVLFATAHNQVDGAFADMIGAGRFKKRSASFFLPQSPNNPKPGAWYLRHVGWLGAAAPAIAGLRDVSFAAFDDDDIVEFAMTDRVRWAFRDVAVLLRRLRDRFIEQDGVENAEKILPAWQIDSIEEAATEPPAASFAEPQIIPPEEAEMPNANTTEQNADFAARETSLATRQADIDARELRLQQQEDAAIRKGITEFADGLVAGGKLLPRQKASVVELLFALEAGNNPTELSFAADDGNTSTVTAGNALRGLLDGLPKQVDFSEHSASEAVDDSVVAFAAPSGTQVDLGRAALHQKALAFQRANAGTSFIDAVRHVGG